MDPSFHRPVPERRAFLDQRKNYQSYRALSGERRGGGVDYRECSVHVRPVVHSFHIHQNSFQIVSQDLGEPGQMIVERLKAGDWRDTVQIPVRGSVTFRINATDYVGKFPFHCHVTAHQGIGMMQLAEVVDSREQCPTTSPPDEIKENLSHLRMAQSECPPWLRGACDAICVAKNCGSELASCMTDGPCRKSLLSVGGCMKTANSSSQYYPDNCLTPDNIKRMHSCSAMEKHHCMLPEKRQSTLVAGKSGAWSVRRRCSLQIVKSPR